MLSIGISYRVYERSHEHATTAPPLLSYPLAVAFIRLFPIPHCRQHDVTALLPHTIIRNAGPHKSSVGSSALGVRLDNVL
jgi:hypothetical protein